MMGVLPPGDTPTPRTKDPTMPRTITPPDALLNRDAFTPKRLAQFDCTNLTQFAKLCGVHRTTLIRAYVGTSSPGQTLINKVIAATGWPYEDIVEKIDRKITILLPGDDGYDAGDWAHSHMGHVSPVT